MSQNPLYLKGRVCYHTRKPPDGNLSYFGYGEIKSYNKTSLPPSDVHELIETFPELDNYTTSPQDPGSVYNSLCGIMDALRAENADSLHYLTTANKIIKASTPFSDVPTWFEFGVPTVDDILTVIASLDRTKHPGFPACNLAPNKGGIIDNYMLDLIQAVSCRMLALIYIAPHCKTPYDFYSTFCADVYCVGIKKEPIKKGKDGRIICSASITTQIVERLLYSEFDQSFKDGCYKTYSAIGVGFTSVDSALLLRGLPEDCVCSDVPKFDSTVTEEEGLLNVDSAWCSYGKPDGNIKLLMTSLERTHFNKMFILPDGNVYYQSKPGYQPSGRDETSNFNTKTRARRAYAAALVINVEFGEEHTTLPKCAGDDCIETYHPKLQDAYDFLRLPLRDVERLKTVVFCSHEWPEGVRPIGTRLYKSLYSMILNEPIPEENALSFFTEYSNHADFSACIRLLSVHRPEMYTHLSSMLSRPIESIPLYVPFAKKKKGKQAVKTNVLANNVSPRPKQPKKGKGKKKSPAQRNNMKRKPKPHHVRAVCSITDPFCPAAKSAKWPDGTAGNTFTEQFRGNLTVGTSSNGNNLVCFSSSAPFGWISSPTSTATTCTLDTAYITYKTNSLFATYGDKFRIVSFGCVIRCVASATSASGLITLGNTTALNPSAVITLGSELYNDVIIRAIQPGMEVSWVSQPLGSSAHTFHLASTNANPADNDEWTSLVIELSGCPASTAMVNVEWFMNIEFTPKTNTTGSNNALTALARPNPPKVTAATDAASVTRSSLGSFIEGGISKVEGVVAKYASDALDSFLSDPLESVAMLFA